MTETAGKTSARRSAKNRGITVERIYTTEGVHPLSLIHI